MNTDPTGLVVSRLERAFKLTSDLSETLSDDELELGIPGSPSNTFGGQIWCVIGARESFLNAIENGKWMGFTCSLENPHQSHDVLNQLEESAKYALKYMKKGNFNLSQLNFIFDLLEHEIQHHGQLIRFTYGNKLPFPASWNERYTV